MEVDSTVTLYNFYGWLHTNRKRVAAGAVIVGVIASAIAIWSMHKTQNETDANQALLSQPLGSGTENAASPTALLNISQNYPGTDAGADAQLLAAKEFFLQSKFDDATQAFSKFIADNPGSPLVPRAQVGIAACLEAQGKTSDAFSKYKDIAQVYSAQTDISYPVKMTLARISESQGKVDAAASIYNELARINNPYDPWIAEAKDRLRYLLAQHPELEKASGANPNMSTSSPLNPTESDIQLSAPPSAPETPPAAPPTINQQTTPLPPMNLSTLPAGPSTNSK